MNDKEIDYVMRQLHTALDPLDPNRFRKKEYNLRNKYGQRVWDGRVKIIDTKNHIDEVNKLIKESYCSNWFISRID